MSYPHSSVKRQRCLECCPAHGAVRGTFTLLIEAKKLGETNEKL
jgi:hypothetical protein